LATEFGHVWSTGQKFRCKERHLIDHLHLNNILSNILLKEKKLDTGRRRKGIVVWERAGREASPSRGQEIPHVSSEHAEPDLQGMESKACPEDPTRLFNNCCGLGGHQLINLKVKLEKRSHPEGTQNWKKIHVYELILFPHHFVFSLAFKKFAYLAYISLQ